MARPVDQLPYLEFEEDSGTVARIYADVWETEEFTSTVQPTENAVETGARIVDHVIIMPKDFRCRMFFSNSPVRGDLDPESVGTSRAVKIKLPEYPQLTPLLSPGGLTQAVGAGISAGLSAIGLGSNGPGLPDRVMVLTFTAPPNRPQRIIQKLVELQEKATLFAVGGSLIRVEGMLLTEVRAARSKTDGDGAGFDLTFRRPDFADTESAEVVPLPL